MSVVLKTTFFALIMLSGVSSISMGQELDYRIIWKGDSIGYLSASVHKEDHQDKYQIFSEASFWFIRRFNLVNKYESIFRDSLVYSAKTESFVNDKLKSSSHLTKNGYGYQILIDGKEVREEPLDIIWPISSIYHRMPDLTNKVFSERFGVFCEWNRVSDNTFELTKPDGRKNLYEYENGVCTRVKVENKFATIYFELLD